MIRPTRCQFLLCLFTWESPFGGVCIHMQYIIHGCISSVLISRKIDSCFPGVSLRVTIKTSSCSINYKGMTNHHFSPSYIPNQCQVRSALQFVACGLVMSYGELDNQDEGSVMMSMLLTEVLNLSSLHTSLSRSSHLSREMTLTPVAVCKTFSIIGALLVKPMV